MEKQLTMQIGVKLATFKIIAEDNTSKGIYYFLECPAEPAFREFYSQNFINQHKA